MMVRPNDRFKNACEFINLGIRILCFCNIHIFQCMGEIFYVEFLRALQISTFHKNLFHIVWVIYFGYLRCLPYQISKLYEQVNTQSRGFVVLRDQAFLIASDIETRPMWSDHSNPLRCDDINITNMYILKEAAYPLIPPAWWRHDIETFSKLLVFCDGVYRSLVISHHNVLIIRTYDGFFVLSLNKQFKFLCCKPQWAVEQTVRYPVIWDAMMTSL